MHRFMNPMERAPELEAPLEPLHLPLYPEMPMPQENSQIENKPANSKNVIIIDLNEDSE